MTEAKENQSNCCENCLFSVDYGKTLQYVKCVRGKRSKWVDKKQACCKDYADKE